MLLEEIEETAGAEEEGYREAELRAILFRVLTPEELDLTQALLEGFKQREIAENLGVSQQAVAARLRKIRDKLKGIIASRSEKKHAPPQSLRARPGAWRLQVCCFVIPARRPERRKGGAVNRGFDFL